MTDGNIRAAKDRLEKAAAALFDPITERFNNRTYTADSLYQQLCVAVHGQTGERSGNATGMPLWTDACDLRIRIDSRMAEHCNGRGHDTLDRIHLLEVRAWRPQDTDQLVAIVSELEEWAAAINTLLDPPQQWTLPNPCPKCDVAVVHRNHAGERIRQPALKIDHVGCHCLNCKTRWTPDLFPTSQG